MVLYEAYCRNHEALFTSKTPIASISLHDECGNAGPMVKMALLHHYYTRNLFILGRPTSRTMACQPHTYGVIYGWKFSCLAWELFYFRNIESEEAYLQWFCINKKRGDSHQPQIIKSVFLINYILYRSAYREIEDNDEKEAIC